MMPNHSSDKQRGSLLVVALGSLMAVGLVSVSLTTLVGQETGTSNNKLLVMRDTAFADSVYLFVRDKLETDTPVSFSEDGELLSADGSTKYEKPTRKELREELYDQLLDNELDDFRKGLRDLNTYIYAEYKLEEQGRFNDEDELLDEDKEEVLYTDPTPKQIKNALSGDDRDDVVETVERLLDRRLPIPD